jgi:hypothetical protein
MAHFLPENEKMALVRAPNHWAAASIIKIRDHDRRRHLLAGTVLDAHERQSTGQDHKKTRHEQKVVAIPSG